jgi:hypothetical protein
VPIAPDDPRTPLELARDGEGFLCREIPDKESITSYMRIHLAQREKWDERPEIGLLVSPYDGHIEAVPMAIPAAVWDAWEDPGKVLAKVARCAYENRPHRLLTFLDHSALATMVGVYIRTEGWTPADGDMERAVSLQRMGLIRSFADLPGAREVRTVLGVLADGNAFEVSHKRDAPGTFRTFYAHLIDQDMPGGNRLSGDYPAYLLLFLYGLVRYWRPASVNEAGPDDVITWADDPRKENRD